MKRLSINVIELLLSCHRRAGRPVGVSAFVGRTQASLCAAFALLLCVGVLSALAGPPEAFAARDYGGTMWKLEGSRISTGESSGSWAIGIRAKADGGPGDSISMGSSKSVSNSVSGNVGIPLKKLNTSFQFNVSKTWSTTASKSYGLTGKKKGSWWAIKYKRVYRNYKLKARQYSFYDGKWHKTKKTRWIRAKKFTHFAYKLSAAKAPN